MDSTLREACFRGASTLKLREQAKISGGLVSAIVLIGAGRTFIAGADVTEFGKPPVPPHLPDLVGHRGLGAPRKHADPQDTSRRLGVSIARRVQGEDQQA